MGTNSPQRKRLRISPLAEQHQVRRDLMAHYRREKAYRNIVVQDLQPLLKRVAWPQPIDNPLFARLGEAYDLLLQVVIPPAFGSEPFELVARETLRIMRSPTRADRSEPHHDELARQLLTSWLIDERGSERRAGARESIALLALASMRCYLYELYRVTARLGLTRAARPAAWAAAFVHADVAAPPGQPAEDPQPYESGGFGQWFLTVRAFARTGGLVTLQRIDQRSAAELPPMLVDATGGAADPLQPFGYLDDLEETVVRQVRAGFAAIRAEVDAAHANRNSATLARRPGNIQLLYGHLYRGDPLDHGAQERLRHLARVLDLDFPRQET